MNAKLAEINYDYQLFYEFLQERDCIKSKELIKELDLMETNQDYLTFKYEINHKMMLHFF